MGAAATYCTTKSEAIVDDLISVHNTEEKPDPNVQFITCKNRKCLERIRINYRERYLEYGVDTRAKDWKPDHARPYCQDLDCSKKFGMLQRKHHCRFCGDVYCDSCTSLRISVNEIAKLSRKQVDNMVQDQNEEDLHRICFECLRKMLQVDCEECGYSFCLLCGKQWHDKMLCFEA